jgi:hypothetical protein
MRISPVWCGIGLLPIAVVLVGFVTFPVLAATDIGKTTIVVRTVTGTLATQSRQLIVHDNVNQNEVIATADDAASEIEFIDGTQIRLGPKARVTLDKFVYDPSPTKSAFFLSVTEGVFRFITGEMAHQSYVITTPNGVIGVRGTIVDVYVWTGKTMFHFDKGSGQAGGATFAEGQYGTVEDGQGRPSTPDEIAILDFEVGLMTTTILASIQPGEGRDFAQLFRPHFVVVNTLGLPGLPIEPSTSVSPIHP